MYTAKRNYGILPRTIGGLMDDVFQNGWNRLNEEIVALNAPVNIQENETGYTLHLVAPGLRKEDFKISIDRGLLTLAYDHKEENENKPDGRWIRTEYKAKSFKRSFTLSDETDAAGISAKYVDGVLAIVIPKKEKSPLQPRDIAIA